MIKQFSYLAEVQDDESKISTKTGIVWAKNLRAAKRVITMRGESPIMVKDLTPAITDVETDELYHLLKLDTKKYTKDVFRRFIWELIIKIKREQEREGESEDV